ncbi:hypothetical protein [Streptomyces pinistramenti]|uniref:hypothetical protein n=1 Tax=Streptomyces pinistramenti TaxID=2884812 RepID=UPI001D08D938|nr:hypothetical protein [Streptomyces pinistramenti]MCB5906163.1 hypothetical protein [Streptomyces pinistramenti]
MDYRLLSLVDGVVDGDDERLPLLTRREARAAVELLQLLAEGKGSGARAARHLAANIARRLPGE